MPDEVKIRKSFLGGFNREDVSAYVESLAKRLRAAKEERDRLAEKCSESEEKLSELTQDKLALQQRLESAENELGGLRAGYEELKNLSDELKQKFELAAPKAEMYDSLRDRIADLELNASRRALEIEKEADARADKIMRRCNDYLANIKSECENASSDTQSSFETIRSELDNLSERISLLSSFLYDKVENFNSSIFGSAAEETAVGANEDEQ